MHRKEQKLTPTEAKARMYRYCAYQERCHQEVKEKLYGFGLSREECDEIMVDLITEGYLNEERYARAFAGGKFRMKKWGRNKIENELEQRGLTPACIRSGLREIEEEQYLDTLRKLLEHKAGQIEADNAFIKRDKIATYAIQKGFEPELVWKMIRDGILP